MFEGNYDALFQGAPAEAWEAIYVEYVDLSGLAATAEYELIKTIHNLDARLRAVPAYVKVNLACIGNFGKLHAGATSKLAKYGHKIPDDLEKAVQVLQAVSKREQRYEHDLKAATASLEKLRGLKVEKNNDTKKQRRQFISKLNTLGTIYRIDRDKTTVEELALMEREQSEKNQTDQINNQFKTK